MLCDELVEDSDHVAAWPPGAACRFPNFPTAISCGPSAALGVLPFSRSGGPASDSHPSLRAPDDALRRDTRHESPAWQSAGSLPSDLCRPLWASSDSANCCALVQDSGRPSASSLSDAGTHAPPPRVRGPGLPFSLGNLLQYGRVESPVGTKSFEAGVLLFRFFKPLEGVLLDAGILALPTLVGRHAQRNHAAGLLHVLVASPSLFGSPQLLDDFLGSVSFSFHRSHWRSCAMTLTTYGPVFGEHSIHPKSIIMDHFDNSIASINGY